LTARRCDRCGHPAVDAIGTRQASLFDVTTDPRATDEARSELRTGRVLCSACQRTPEMFQPAAPLTRDEADANRSRRGSSGYQEWMDLLCWQKCGAATLGSVKHVCADCAIRRERDARIAKESQRAADDEAESLPGEAEADAALRAEAVRDLDDEGAKGWAGRHVYGSDERWSPEDHARAFGPGHYRARNR
jgi:hypothetical protein